jgi:hypothetical protein
MICNKETFTFKSFRLGSAVQKLEKLLRQRLKRSPGNADSWFLPSYSTARIRAVTLRAKRFKIARQTSYIKVPRARASV